MACLSQGSILTLPRLQTSLQYPFSSHLIRAWAQGLKGIQPFPEEEGILAISKFYHLVCSQSTPSGIPLLAPRSLQGAFELRLPADIGQQVTFIASEVS